MSGAAFPRPFFSVDHVRALLQTAASPSSTAISSSSSSRSALPSSWSPRPHRWSIPQARRGPDSLGFLGQQDGSGILAELSGHPSSAHQQPISPPMMLRGRFKEGEADSESKGSNHQSVSRKSALKKEPSLLLSLVQEIQPLDVSHISKEASPDSTDAMKRTISGMLGLLPSDQFQVTVETSCEPLAKLLVSSMMTGYTLRNAEYRLCLQKSLEFSDDDEVEGGQDKELLEHEAHYREVESIFDPVLHEEDSGFTAGKSLEAFQGEQHVTEDEMETLESLGTVSEEAKGYIHFLKQKLASVSKELEDCKRINTGLQVQSIVGEEKNDLLDYLRSLAPDKVAELSQPTSPEVEDVIQQVINGLLDNPSTKLQHRGTQFGNGPASTYNGPWEEDGTQKFSISPLQSQSAVTVNRDHLARLLFWCMLLGHHMRGLEYRLELSRTLSLSGDLDSGVTERNQDG